MEVLRLANNQIADISPLASIVSLENLSLSDNQITDISPLTPLVNIRYIYLYNNQVADISPLVDNQGVGPDDTVIILENPLSAYSCTDLISVLEARDVRVAHDCQ